MCSGGRHRRILALDYTITRPAWLTDRNEVGYELTGKGEAFKGTEASI